MEDYRSRVPWAREPSLKEKAREVGVDFDRLIRLLGEGRSDAEMAADFGVPPPVVAHLRQHFERYGLASIVGQD
ncbi:MAG: helix-turn-helix domain-containing protein [Clostridia bacterium]|nr:helix-turn-helix domain-containing protein [Clostridia bacterium]